MNANRDVETFARTRWIAGALAALLLISGGVLGLRAPAEAADVVVYKSPSCGCCGAWVAHLEENGFTVESRNRDDMALVKDEMGVPTPLRSCHTATVEGYVIEGHVPADDIARMLKERPAIKGLAVAGMPMGSPGMEGPRKDPYEVTAFETDGTTSVYERH